MSGSPAKQPRFERLRAIHRRMPFETFQQLPHQLGWKHEYYGGKAHITPGPTLVTFVLPLEPPPAQSDKGIRPLLEKDLPALHSPFIDAFRLAPEYADFSLDEFHQRAAQYLHGFFGTVRGEWSPVSVVVEIQGRIVGAAMVKQRQSGPLLDCLFVCPGQARKGLGTALVNRVVEGLLQRGETQLVSYAMLANDASMAWHHRFGFREIPDLYVSSLRHRFFFQELERHRRLADLSLADLAALEETVARYESEVERLRELELRVKD